MGTTPTGQFFARSGTLIHWMALRVFGMRSEHLGRRAGTSTRGKGFQSLPSPSPVPLKMVVLCKASSVRGLTEPIGSSGKAMPKQTVATCVAGPLRAAWWATSLDAVTRVLIVLIIAV